MFNKLQNNKNLLPALLLLALIIILVFLAYQATATAFPAPSPTVTRTQRSSTNTPLPDQALSAAQAATITLTPRHTWTLAPTNTPTPTATAGPTATQTPLPTLTPALPLEINDLYRLRRWDPERAEELVRLFEGYPDAVFTGEEERRDPAYNAAFRYPAFAYEEALLRFSEDPAANAWRWGLAYTLTHFDPTRAGEMYADLLVEALNSGETTLPSLPDWFSQQEKRLSLNVIDFDPPAGYISSAIVEIHDRGAAYIWLVELPAGYQAYLLESRFNFADEIRSSFISGDLTGDGAPEAVVFYSPSGEDFNLTTPKVFDLSNAPPGELPFKPDLPFDFGMEFSNEWFIVDNSDGGSDLQFIGSTFPSCAVRVTRSYSWNGSLFDYPQTHYNLQPDPELLPFCEFIITHAANVWEAEVTAELLRTLLPAWPPDARADGKPYPEDAYDEMRFRLGVYLALAGARDEAERYLNEIAGDPVVPTSRWITHARQFLQTYQSEDGLYRACTEALLCDTRSALKGVAGAVPLNDYDRVTAYLQRFGVALRSSGIFDFENDGSPERWLLVRHQPGQKLELWILARTNRDIRAVFVNGVDSDQVAPYYREPVGEPPIVQIRAREGFILERVPVTLEPYISRVSVEFMPTTFTRDALEEASLALFSGNVTGALDRLEATLKSPRFNCSNYRICDRFYYTLGLAYELTGEERAAIDTYIDLWWNYSASPYTLMARHKLDQIQVNTPTPTTTITATLTPTRDPNATGTPTPTMTLTPDPNATPTATATPTSTSEAYP